MKYGVIFFLAIFLFASCEKNNQYETEIELWKSHNIYNYNYQVRMGGMLSYEYIVEIRNDKVVNAMRTYYALGEKLEKAEQVSNDRLKDFYTFDGYYYWLDSLKADKITIEQNSIYGYPKDIRIDFNKNAIDDEFYYDITNVEFLKD